MARRFLWLSLFLLVFGCERNLRAKKLDEPCTRTAQCDMGLVCLAGVCRPESESGDGDPLDGGM